MPCAVADRGQVLVDSLAKPAVKRDAWAHCTCSLLAAVAFGCGGYPPAPAPSPPVGFAGHQVAPIATFSSGRSAATRFLGATVVAYELDEPCEDVLGAAFCDQVGFSIARSVDSLTWSVTPNLDPLAGTDFTDFVLPRFAFAEFQGSLYLAYLVNERIGLARSADGINWTILPASPAVAAQPGSGFATVQLVVSPSGELWASATFGLIARFDPGAGIWKSSVPLPDGIDVNGNRFGFAGNLLVLVHTSHPGASIFSSDDEGQTWTGLAPVPFVSEDDGDDSIAGDGIQLLAGLGDELVNLANPVSLDLHGYAIATTTDGSSWLAGASGDLKVQAAATDGTRLTMFGVHGSGTFGDGYALATSVDGGRTFIEKPFPIFPGGVTSMSREGSHIDIFFASPTEIEDSAGNLRLTYPLSVATSLDDGATWF
jgi:hypothetical protein